MEIKDLTLNINFQSIMNLIYSEYKDLEKISNSTTTEQAIQALNEQQQVQQGSIHQAVG